jgi:hypothetical protein
VSEDTLARLEAIVDASGVATEIEARLPLGVRRRQLRVRTLLVGLLLTLADGRPAHLSRVHGALVALGAHDRRRLGICVEHRGAVHLLTYRQVEYTFSLVVRALGKEHPDGTPSGLLAQVVDALCEASVPALYKEASSSLAVDWSDQETFAFPTRAGAKSADPEATWGHRRGGPTRGELFFGYYFSAATMVSDEGAGQVPELVRRMALSSCAIDPVPLFVGVLERMSHDGVAFGDVLADSGYAHRLPEHWALPLRRLGAHLVMDLHPHDRGTRGTFGGAICFNGNLYCPSTPRALFELEPLARTADVAGTTAHDARSAELARYKLGRINGDDDDGYHRVMCPAAMGKVRCPARPESMALSLVRPEITSPPAPAPSCCTQKTLTVPPEVNAKTVQKHDYPSRAHRVSYARRTAVERAYATMKDPASTDVRRGWCRVMGLCGITILLTCGVVVRNLRILDAFEERQREDLRRRTAGLEPRTRRRRRRTLDDLTSTKTA